MKVNCPVDCGNSPKMALVKELTILFASYKLEELEQYFADDIVWNLVGDEPITGKDNFIKALEEMQDNKAVELDIQNVMSHGKVASMYGEMTLSDGSRFKFSDFYTFKSAGSNTIQSITSFVIQLQA